MALAKGRIYKYTGRIENAEINPHPHLYSLLMFDKGTKKIQWKKDLNTWCWGTSIVVQCVKLLPALPVPHIGAPV